MNFKLKHMELLLIILVLSIGTIIIYCLHSSFSKNTLKNESFTGHPLQNKVLMLFYADWCGYSRQFLPVWDEIVKNVNIRTQRINVDQNNGLSNDFQISSLPTLYLVDGNTRTKYEGPRTKSAILDFISKQ